MLSPRFVLPSGAAQGAARRRAERLIRASLWALLIWSIVSGAVGAAVGSGSRAMVLSNVFVSGSLAVAALGGQWLIRSWRVTASARFLVVLLYVSLTVMAVLRGTSMFVLYGLLVLTAGLLLGREVAVLTVALSIVTGLCVADLRAGWPVSALPAAGAALYWVEEVLALGWIAWLVSLEMADREAGSVRPRQQRTRTTTRLAEDESHPQLAQLERRNRYLQGIATINQDTAGLVAADELLTRCAVSIRSRLSLGRVCIYPVDVHGERLVQGVRADATDETRPMEKQCLAAEPSSLARRALRLGSPALDTETTLGIGDRSPPPGAQAGVALPLHIDGEIAGVLELCDSEGDGFSREDVALLQLLADQVAASLRWARAASLLQRRAQRKVAERHTSVADEWRRVLQEHRRLAVIRNEDGLVQAQDAWWPGMSEAVRSGQVAFGDPGQNVVAVPVRARDRVVAVVGARKPESAAPWDEREIALVQAICAQVGHALENARLYEAVQRREERERLLGQAAARMRESLDVETVLRVATDEIRHALGLAALEVRLEMEGEVDA